MLPALTPWAAASVPAAFLTAAVIDRAQRRRDVEAAKDRHPAGKAARR